MQCRYRNIQLTLLFNKFNLTNTYWVLALQNYHGNPSGIFKVLSGNCLEFPHPSTLQQAGRGHLGSTHAWLHACIQPKQQKGETDGGKFVKPIIYGFLSQVVSCGAPRKDGWGARALISVGAKSWFSYSGLCLTVHRPHTLYQGRTYKVTSQWWWQPHLRHLAAQQGVGFRRLKLAYVRHSSHSGNRACPWPRAGNHRISDLTGLKGTRGPHGVCS